MIQDSDFIATEMQGQGEVLFDSGGTADCYKLIQGNRLYCVKRPKEPYRDSEAYLHLFSKEYELGTQLEHPNIVRYDAYDTDERGPFIRMEYVDGDNLEKFVEQYPHYFDDQRNRRRFLDELLSAIAYLHGKKMLHLDLKPRNILLTRKGHNVKIIDLGFGWDERFLYDMGFTRDYCAPEQLTAKTDELSPASDIYALGKILRNFHLAPDSVTRRCLCEDPKERFQSVAELKKALQRHARGSKVLKALCGVVGIALIGGLVWFALQEKETASVDEVPEGALCGRFSVNEQGDQVRFSKGNLQFQASTRQWRFAEHQWDFVGNDSVGNVYENGVKCDNRLSTAHYDGWIDLFGWGNSGYNHGADCYQPWPCESDHQFTHAAYGCDSCHLYERTGKADWGYNAIVNGGNQEALWRSLTVEECRCLLYKRETVSGMRYAKAVVNGINGLLVIPDDWEPNVYPLQYADDNTIPFDANVISLEDWERVMEPHGMVFLPAGGTVKHREPFWDITGHWGGYWSASRGYPWLCYLIRFGDDFVWGDEIWYPHARQAVRVVRNVRRKK